MLDAEAANDHAFVLKYRVERSEIWRWYWWSWHQPRGLWSYWVFVCAAVATGCYFFRTSERPATLDDMVISLIAALAICFFFILYPQIMYKTRERILRVTGNGLDTSIGAMSGRRDWKDISSIIDRGNYVAIVVAGGIPLGVCWLRTLNGNAFIVPNRAFHGASERAAFLDQARRWHAANAVRFPKFSRSRYYGSEVPPV
jgi:hypothetical protein